MFAKFMTFCNGNENFRVENPTWMQVEQAIASLEAYDHLILSPSEGDENLFGMRVANKGFYVCSYYDGDEYDLESENGQGLNPPLENGEFTFYSTAEFVDLDIALKAAKTYLESGEMNTSLIWRDNNFDFDSSAIWMIISANASNNSFAANGNSAAFIRRVIIPDMFCADALIWALCASFNRCHKFLGCGVL